MLTAMRASSCRKISGNRQLCQVFEEVTADEREACLSGQSKSSRDSSGYDEGI
jgi:hypothetical protein